MIGQLTTAKKIHLDTHKIEYYVASPLWSTYVGYKMENFETQKIHDEVWCYWEQLVEYMRIWGTHTHTLRASSLGTFLATPKPKRKNHQQVKGHNKRVNGPLNTDSQKFKRTPSLDS